MAEQYSLPDVLSKMYENQLATEAVLMVLVLLEEGHGSSEACENARTGSKGLVRAPGIRSRDCKVRRRRVDLK